MKLVLQRFGERDSWDTGIDGRPFALCTEDGQVLLGQQSTSLQSRCDELPTITVVFIVDGADVSVKGDLPKPARIAVAK